MILVIGGTGKVGSALVRALDHEGKEVRVLTRNPARAERLDLHNAEIVRGNLADPDSLETAFEEIDRLFVLSPAGPDQTIEFRRVIDLACRRHLEMVVQLSAMGASPDSCSQIFRWHAEDEEYLKRSGLPFVILRPNFFMQNALVYAATVVESGEFFAPLGSGRASSVDVRDVAAVALEVLVGDEGPDLAGATLELTGPEALSGERIAGVMSEVLGRGVRYTPVSEAVAVESLRGVGLPEWAALDLACIYRYWSESLNDRITEHVRIVTGRDPLSFRRFMEDFASVYRKKA